MDLSEKRPYILERKPFSESEKEILSAELQRTSEDILIKVLTGLGLAFLFAILPTRRHPSLISEHGFSKGLLIAILIIGVLILWNTFLIRRKYKKDLLEGSKIIRQTTILRKERSFLQKKHFVWVDEKEPNQQKFEIEADIYNNLHKGQRISMEFAPYSRQLLHIDWQI